MSKRQKKNITIRDLEKDAEFRKQNPEFSDQLRRDEMKRQRVFGALLRQLADAGYEVGSINEIAKRYAPLPNAAVKILMGSIESFDEDGLKETVIRQLVAPDEPFDGRPLVACFEGTTNSSLRWAILNTIACSRPHSIDDWLREATRDTWIEKTLLAIGRQAHGCEFDDYLESARAKGSTGLTRRADAGVRTPRGRYQLVYAPILERLAQVGFAVQSIEELRDRHCPLPEPVVEILLSSLQRLDDKAKLLILQTLEKTAQPFDGRPLTACYDSTSDKLVRDNALLTIAVTKLHSIDNWINALDPQTKKKLKALRHLA